MAVFLILLIINHMLLIIHPNKDLTQANHGLIESNTETSFQKRGYYLIYSYIISYPPSMIWSNEVKPFSKGTVFKFKKSTEKTLFNTHSLLQILKTRPLKRTQYPNYKIKIYRFNSNVGSLMS